MILQDFLNEDVAIECISEVEINSMLCILKKIGDEVFVENFKKNRKDNVNSRTGSSFIFFRKNGENNYLIDVYMWSYKVVRLTKEIYKEMKKDLENENNIIGTTMCHTNLIGCSENLGDCISMMSDFNTATICANNFNLREEKERMINLDGFLNNYKKMVEEKLMKERKEKVKKLKEKDCYTIQIKKIKDNLINSFNVLIKDSGEEMDLICNSDVDIMIKDKLSEDFISKETKEKIAKAEMEELEKIKELDNKIKEVKTACMLSTNEEKIQQILINYKFITKDGKLTV